MAVVTKAERLRLARREAGFRYAADAARAMGISGSTYVHHENGTRDFTNEAAELYAKRYKVPFDWLVRGIGEITYGDNENGIEDGTSGEAQTSKFDVVEDYDSGEEDALQFERQERLEGSMAIPLISPSYAEKAEPGSNHWSRFIDLETRVVHPILGYWGIPSEYADPVLEASEKTLILYPYTGDYMSPTFVSGDLLFIDTATQGIHADGLYLVADRDSTPQFRRVRRIFGSKPSRVTLVCDNPAIPPQEVEVDNLLVIGQALGRITIGF